MQKHSFMHGTPPFVLSMAMKMEGVTSESLTCWKACEGPRPLRPSKMLKSWVTVQHGPCCCSTSVPGWCSPWQTEACLPSCSSIITGITALCMHSLCFDEFEAKVLTAAGQTHSMNQPQLCGVWRSCKCWIWQPWNAFGTQKAFRFFYSQVSVKIPSSQIIRG